MTDRTLSGQPGYGALSAVDQAIVWSIIFCASAGYLILSHAPLPFGFAKHFGSLIYNYYFLSVIDGRLDVPVRIVSMEGHYTQDGRAFVYHGIAPLITRALAYPFVDLATYPMGKLTVWICAVIGTTALYLESARLIGAAAIDTAARRFWLILMGLMVWISAPGFLLASNQSIYHEPIAIAFAACAVFVVLSSRVVQGRSEPGAVLIGLALCAAITVHARPHLALGLYLGVGLMVLLHHRREGWSQLARSVGVISILGASGLLLLGWNALRFEDALLMHGSFERGGLEHGVIFWGTDSPDSPRAQGFIEHGRFNVYRILPNAMLYTFDLWSVTSPIRQLWEQMTAHVGFLRIEEPHVGIFYLWLPWIMLIALGLSSSSVPTQGAWIMMVSVGIGTLMMLAYPTITMRYRFDMWPVFAAAALLMLPRVLTRVDGSAMGARLVVATSFCVTVPLIVTIFYFYRAFLREAGAFSIWSYEFCEAMVLYKGLSSDDVARICAL